MEYIILLVLCALCVGMMVVMYHKNQELVDHVKRNEVKISDLEKLVNAAEHDTMIRSRLSNTETRISAVERNLKSQLAEVASKIPAVIEQPPPVVVAPVEVVFTVEEKKVLNGQVELLDTRVRELVDLYNNRVGKAIAELSKKSLMLDANACVLSPTETCPSGLTKTATFGIISYPHENRIPKGYYHGGSFNDHGWKWLHGGLCCIEHEIIKTVAAAAT